MSWFDTAGIASLAKNALKEAQKTIDKALDIKDDTVAESPSTESTIPTSEAESSKFTTMKHSASNSALQQSSIWGSFTGSFFDNPTVTTPPSSSSAVTRINQDLCDILERSTKEDTPNDSEGNSSASVEIVSPPTTPGSNLTSPGQLLTVHNSESVEVISITTPSSDLITVSSSSPSEKVLNSFGPNPGSVEVISYEFMDEDLSIEDDSKSYNTITESTTVVTVFEGSREMAITTAPSRSGLHLSLEASTADLIKPPSDAKSSSDTKIIISDSETKKVPRLIEDAMLEKPIESFDSQAQFSDSTHSFEEVPPQDGCNRSDSPHSSDEHSDIVKVSSEQNSGDEIETATSSDIEITSSSNGDSSSTNSALKVSPLNCSMQHSDSLSNKKGHCRELLTHSMQSNTSDDSRVSYQSETERLMRRINELSDILESREYKLMELGRENAELHEKNAEMKTR